MQVGELFVKLSLDMKDFKKAVDDAGTTLKGTAEKLNGIGKDMTAKITAPIVGIGGLMTKMAVDFDDAMAKVSTIADTTAVPLNDLKTGIMDLSNQTGISASEIADNVYNAISAGQSTGDAVAFVEKSSMLAKAGFAEAGQSLDLLTTIMNSYGLEASEVNKVSDILIQTQNKGKTTVGELSTSMGKVIPTAKAFGVGLEQVGASYAIMTSKGIATAEAGTYVSAMMNELGKSGTTASKYLQDLSGKSFKELIDSGMSVGDILEMLGKEADDMGVSLADMFGSAEAGKAALVLLGDGADTFNASVADMANSTGMTEEAFAKLQTDGEKARIAFNEVKNALIEFGNAILPALTPIAAVISDLASKFAGLDESTKTTIVVLAGIAAVVGPIIVVVTTVITKIMALQSLFVAIGPIIAGISAPIAIAIGAVAALIAIGVLLWKNWDEIKAKAQEIWDNIKTKLSKDLDDITTRFAKLKDDIVNKWNEMWENVKTFLANAIQNIVTKIVAFISIFITKWEEMKENVKRKWDEMWKYVIQAISNAWNGIVNALNAIGSNMSNWFSDLANKARDWGSNMIQGFVDGIRSMIGKVRDVSSQVTRAVGDFIGFNSPSKKGEGRNIVKWGKNMVSGFEDGIIQAMPDLQKTMSAAIPAMGSIGGSGSVSNSYGGVTVQNMTVRNDGDIDLIAKKLFDLQTKKGRGLGIA